MPGDNDYFGAVESSEIHGDRRITSGSPEYPDDDDTYYDGEAGRFWFDLSQMGLKNENGTAYPNFTPGGIAITPGINAPLAKIGNKASIVVFVDDVPNSTGYGNYYYVDVYSSDNLHFNDNALAAKDLLAVDAKIDDSKADSGNMFSRICASGSNYDLTLTCGTRIRVGVSTGELK